MQLAKQMGDSDRFGEVIPLGTLERLYACDRQEHRLYITPATAEVLGFKPAEIVGKSWYELGLPQSLCASLSRYVTAAITTEQPVREWLKVHRDNRAHPIVCHINPVSYSEDGTKGAVVELRCPADVARDLDLGQILTECAPVGVAIVRIPDWFSLYANYACGAMIGAGSDDLSGRDLTEWFERPCDPMRLMEKLMGGEGFHNMEVPLVHHNGERIWALVSGSRTVYQGASVGMLVFNKISEHRQLRELASHDALTALPDRNYLQEQLELAMTRANRVNQRVGVLFIDLDGFKKVNDCYGHQSGDRLLVALARRLASSVRAYDTVARIGGDEFVVILERLEERGHAERIARDIVRALSGPVRLVGGGLAKVSASIGIAIFPSDGSTSDELLKHSDAAMYQAKRAGSGRIQSHTPSAPVQRA